jgi:uncharacterized metal-binding protein
MEFTCADCAIKACEKRDYEKMPKNCPSKQIERQEEIKEIYKSSDENMKIAYNSAITEQRGYLKECRVEETINFLKRMECKNIGLAFCIGLKKEAETLVNILRYHDFTVNSVVCKNGGISKEFIGVDKKDFVHGGDFEAMCNPIGQAQFLNDKNTEFNILLGLCVGHDSLFLKYSEAPVTVIGVKDRVLCHNPIAALYGAEGYYKSKLFY